MNFKSPLFFLILEAICDWGYHGDSTAQTLRSAGAAQQQPGMAGKGQKRSVLGAPDTCQMRGCTQTQG